MDKNSEIYIVIAERWDDNNNHSYLVGWHNDFYEAKLLATKEAEWRGGKYAGVIFISGRGWKKNRKEVWRFPSQVGDDWTEEHHQLFKQIEQEEAKKSEMQKD